MVVSSEFLGAGAATTVERASCSVIVHISGGRVRSLFTSQKGAIEARCYHLPLLLLLLLLSLLLLLLSGLD